MKRNKTDKLKPVTAKAWSGKWIDGYLGWWMSEFLYPRGCNDVNGTLRKYGYKNPIEVYRVKVTVEPVFDKLGRPIKKIVKPRKEQ